MSKDQDIGGVISQPPISIESTSLDDARRKQTRKGIAARLGGAVGLGVSYLLHNTGLTPVAAPMAAGSATYLWHTILQDIDGLLGRDVKASLEELGLDQVMPEDQFETLVDQLSNADDKGFAFSTMTLANVLSDAQVNELISAMKDTSSAAQSFEALGLGETLDDDAATHIEERFKGAEDHAAFFKTLSLRDVLGDEQTNDIIKQAKASANLEALLSKSGLADDKAKKMANTFQSDFFRQNMSLLLSLSASKKVATSGLAGDAMSSLVAGAIALYGVVGASDVFVDRLNQFQDRNNISDGVIAPLAGIATSSAEMAASGVAASSGQTDMAIANISASNTSNALMVGAMALFLGKKTAEAKTAKIGAWIATGFTFVKMAAIASIGMAYGLMPALAVGGGLAAIAFRKQIKNYLTDTMPRQLSNAWTTLREGISDSWAVENKTGKSAKAISAFAKASVDKDTYAGFSNMVQRNAMPLLGKGAALGILVACADVMLENAEAFGEAMDISDEIMAGVVGIGTNAPEAATAAAFIKNKEYEKAFGSTIVSNAFNVAGAGGLTAALSTDGLPDNLSQPLASPENARDFALIAAAPAVNTAAAAWTLSAGEKARIPGAATTALGTGTIAASALYL